MESENKAYWFFPRFPGQTAILGFLPVRNFCNLSYIIAVYWRFMIILLYIRYVIY